MLLEIRCSKILFNILFNYMLIVHFPTNGTFQSLRLKPGGRGGVLPYISYMETCRLSGMVFGPSAHKQGLKGIKITYFDLKNEWNLT